MSKKLTRAQRLAKRKYKPSNKFIYWLYKVIMVNIVGKKYNMKFNVIDQVPSDGPCFVVFNHLSRIDHVYVMGATYPRVTTMIAANNEFYRSKFSLVFALNNCIPKKCYTADNLTIKGVSRVLKKGGCVTFAPEGETSQYGENKPVVPGTSKMFKHFMVPVYFCHIQGQHLQCNKVCTDVSLGETHATLSLLFSKDDVANLSVEQMDDILNEKFRHDDYAWNAERKIKWKTKGRTCVRLEDFCYKCPKCGSEFTMKGVGNKFTCSHCGNGATMDDYFQFHPYDGAVIPLSPVEWVKQERMDIIKQIRQDPNYFFEDDCKLGNLHDYKLVGHNNTTFIVGEGKVRVDHKGLHYTGTRHGEPYQFSMDYKSLYTLMIAKDGNHFCLYNRGEYFEFFPSRQTVGKFCLLVEEMHRYHVNFYKNFKWYDYMYEGMELGIDNN